MSVVGRNYPCPCGSGLKFNKCCLNKTAAVVNPYTFGERGSVLAKLMRFASHHEFDENHKAALELFWGDWLKERDEDLDAVIKSEQANVAYHSWFVFDFDLGDGRTVFDSFLEQEGEKLSSGERSYLEGMRGSHLRLYEILEVKPDQGFELRDLWDDRRLYVQERAATRQLVAWDLIIGRIGSSGDGEIVFETLPYVFPASAKDGLVKGIRDAYRIFTGPSFREKGVVNFFKHMAPILHYWWVGQVALRPLPKLITGDGEPFIFAKVIFELLDPGAVIASLADRDGIVDHGDGSYVWLEPARASQRSVGTIVVEGKRVVFETTSQKHAEKARDELTNLLGNAVRFRAISYQDVGQALKHGPAVAKREAPAVPPEVQAEALGRFYGEHYRKWLDEPVPALGNRTSRRAARLKTVRPKLVALLKDFESHSERQRRAGEIAYDFSWMWKELGLNRE